MGLVDAATLAEPSLNAAGKAQGKREKQAETGLGSSPLNSFFEDKASIQMTMKEENKEEEKQMDEAIPDGIEGDEEESEEENNLKFVKFRRWMEDNGCIFPNLILKKYSSNYRGVHVSSPSKDVIPEGSVILHIPHEMLITVELAKESEIGQLIADCKNTLGSQSILALYLLQERYKAKESKWWPWLNVLPSSFETMPMFFSPHLIMLLQGCDDLLIKIESQKKSMRSEYAAIRRVPGIAKALRGFSFDSFVWGCLAVGTRVFSLSIAGQKTSVLAPFADMMNHKHPAGTSWSYDGDVGAFTLTACADLEDGEQVHESYGPKDNKRFFASYGFCLENNPANEVSICIRRSPNSMLVRQFIVRANYDGGCKEMFSFLRIVNSRFFSQSEDEFSHFGEGYEFDSTPPRTGDGFFSSGGGESGDDGTQVVENQEIDPARTAHQMLDAEDNRGEEGTSQTEAGQEQLLRPEQAANMSGSPPSSVWCEHDEPQEQPRPEDGGEVGVGAEGGKRGKGGEGVETEEGGEGDEGDEGEMYPPHSLVNDFELPAEHGEHGARSHWSHAAHHFGLGSMNEDSMGVLMVDTHGPLSVANELAALQCLRETCREHLSQYSTLLEEDLMLLADPEAPYNLPDEDGSKDRTNARNCILFRSEEKKIYHLYIDWAEVAMSLLCAPWTEAREMIRNFFQPVVNSDGYNSQDCDSSDGIEIEAHQHAAVEPKNLDISSARDRSESSEGDQANRWKRPETVFAHAPPSSSKPADSEPFRPFSPLLPFPYNSIPRAENNQMNPHRKLVNYHLWLAKQHKQADSFQAKSIGERKPQNTEINADKSFGSDARPQNDSIDMDSVEEEKSREDEQQFDEDLDGFEPYHTEMVFLSALMLPYVSSVIVPLLQQREYMQHIQQRGHLDEMEEMEQELHEAAMAATTAAAEASAAAAAARSRARNKAKEEVQAAHPASPGAIYAPNGDAVDGVGGADLQEPIGNIDEASSNWFVEEGSIPTVDNALQASTGGEQKPSSASGPPLATAHSKITSTEPLLHSEPHSNAATLASPKEPPPTSQTIVSALPPPPPPVAASQEPALPDVSSCKPVAHATRSSSSRASSRQAVRFYGRSPRVQQALPSSLSSSSSTDLTVAAQPLSTQPPEPNTSLPSPSTQPRRISLSPLRTPKSRRSGKSRSLEAGRVANDHKQFLQDDIVLASVSLSSALQPLENSDQATGNNSEDHWWNKLVENSGNSGYSSRNVVSLTAGPSSPLPPPPTRPQNNSTRLDRLRQEASSIDAHLQPTESSLEKTRIRRSTPNLPKGSHTKSRHAKSQGSKRDTRSRYSFASRFPFAAAALAPRPLRAFAPTATSTAIRRQDTLDGGHGHFVRNSSSFSSTLLPARRTNSVSNSSKPIENKSYHLPQIGWRKQASPHTQSANISAAAPFAVMRPSNRRSDLVQDDKVGLLKTALGAPWL